MVHLKWGLWTYSPSTWTNYLSGWNTQLIIHEPAQMSLSLGSLLFPSMLHLLNRVPETLWYPSKQLRLLCMQPALSNCLLNTWVKAKIERALRDSSSDCLRETVLLLTSIVASILHLLWPWGHGHMPCFESSGFNFPSHLFSGRRSSGLWKMKSCQGRPVGQCVYVLGRLLDYCSLGCPTSPGSPL